MVPTQLSLVQDPETLPQSRSEHLRQLTEKLHAYHRLVDAAHERSRVRNAISYNEHQIDVQFAVGDHVLRYIPKRHNKLRFHWHGPYVVMHKVNPATYMIKDPTQPDAPLIPASIQHLTPVINMPSERIEDPDHLSVYPPSFRDQFEQGKFVIFRKPNSGSDWRRRLYVAEVYEDYDRSRENVLLHYYADFG
ncbi:MAG: hypothetical protein AAGD07_25340, partial [Planctomycetota bacterium]